MNNLTDSEKAEVLSIATMISKLSRAPGWPEFVKAANALADSHIGKYSQFSDTEAVIIASKVAYASGIRACIGIVTQQERILASLKKTEE
jgi:hypothetical protein